jgi:hypothetical protein
MFGRDSRVAIEVIRGAAMARTKAVLGDARRDDRAAWMLDRIVASGSLVMREVGGDRSGEIAAHRLLSCEDVEPAALLAPHVARTAEACRGRRVVAAQDTSEINFDWRRQPATGLGPTGNPGVRGFFVHPVVAIDAEDEALLGIVGARIWTRGEEATPDHRDIAFDQKESRRWLEGAESAAAHLGQTATQVVMVADREGDIYPMFARSRKPSTSSCARRMTVDWSRAERCSQRLATGQSLVVQWCRLRLSGRATRVAWPRSC